MADKQLSAQDRAMLFSQATRQTFQTLGAVQVNSELSTVSFSLPKSRLLSKIWLEFEGSCVNTSPTAPFFKPSLSPMQMIRRIEVNLNNGFSPFILSGRDLHLYTINRMNPITFKNIGAGYEESERRVQSMDLHAKPDGHEGKFKFIAQLPLTLNDRDAVGLVLLQNEETVVNVTIDMGVVGDAYQLNDGETCTFKSLQITPMLETYTIPPSPLAFPDLSVLKLVQAKEENFNANTMQTVKLNTGTIYRKMCLYFVDENGKPLRDEDFLGNIELVFNTADTPFSIKPSILTAKNSIETYSTESYPHGVYMLDFSNQGIPNMGGSRDYIDTERLTEFWLRFTTKKAGKVSIISETLSRLV